MPLPRALTFLWLMRKDMRVMEVVRRTNDKIGSEIYGKVIAVQGSRSNLITVSWENGKVSDHSRSDLTLVESPFREVVLSE